MSDPTAIEPTPAPAQAPASTAPGTTVPGASARRSAERDTGPLLFDEANVSVSAARIVAYGTPFPLAGTRGVRLFKDQPHLRFAIPILIAGILLGVYGIIRQQSPAMALGFMLVVVSYLTYRFQTMRHRIFLIRDTGETEVLASSSLPFAQRVHAAVEQALQTGVATPAATATGPQTA